MVNVLHAKKNMNKDIKKKYVLMVFHLNFLPVMAVYEKEKIISIIVFLVY